MAGNWDINYGACNSSKYIYIYVYSNCGSELAKIHF